MKQLRVARELGEVAELTRRTIGKSFVLLRLRKPLVSKLIGLEVPANLAGRLIVYAAIAANKGLTRQAKTIAEGIITDHETRELLLNGNISETTTHYSCYGRSAAILMGFADATGVPRQVVAEVIFNALIENRKRGPLIGTLLASNAVLRGFLAVEDELREAVRQTRDSLAQLIDGSTEEIASCETDRNHRQAIEALFNEQSDPTKIAELLTIYSLFYYMHTCNGSTGNTHALTVAIASLTAFEEQERPFIVMRMLEPHNSYEHSYATQMKKVIEGIVTGETELRTENLHKLIIDAAKRVDGINHPVDHAARARNPGYMRPTPCTDTAYELLREQANGQH